MSVRVRSDRKLNFMDDGMTAECSCMPHSHPNYYVKDQHGLLQRLMPNQRCILNDFYWTSSDDCYSSSRSMPS